MPYLYALIEAAEREAVLSHLHAMEGAEMGEGFAGLLGRRPICLLRDSLFRERGWLSGAPCAPTPPEIAA
jgi:hypothetical protein